MSPGAKGGNPAIRGISRVATRMNLLLQIDAVEIAAGRHELHDHLLLHRREFGRRRCDAVGLSGYQS